MSRFLRVRRGDGGASAVEFALLFPVFIVLAMGIIATGTAFSKQLNVTQAVREASRFGATLDYQNQSPPLTLDEFLTRVDQAAIAAAGNATDPLGGYDYRCVALVTTKTVSGVVVVDTAKSKYMENGGTPNAGACPSVSAAPIQDTDYVQVAMYRKSSFFVVFANPTIKLDSVSVTPFEGKAVP